MSRVESILVLVVDGLERQSSCRTVPTILPAPATVKVGFFFSRLWLADLVDSQSSCIEEGLFDKMLDYNRGWYSV